MPWNRPPIDGPCSLLFSTFWGAPMRDASKTSGLALAGSFFAPFWAAFPVAPALTFTTSGSKYWSSCWASKARSAVVGDALTPGLAARFRCSARFPSWSCVKAAAASISAGSTKPISCEFVSSACCSGESLIDASSEMFSSSGYIEDVPFGNCTADGVTFPVLELPLSTMKG